MKTSLLSLLAGTALMTSVAAQAGEPITLDSSQLDKVAAGAAAAGASTGANQAAALAVTLNLGTSQAFATPTASVVSAAPSVASAGVALSF